MTQTKTLRLVNQKVTGQIGDQLPKTKSQKQHVKEECFRGSKIKWCLFGNDKILRSAPLIGEKRTHFSVLCTKDN